MRILYKFHIILLFLLLAAGCSSQPVQEINAAKAAVDNVVSEGAEKYAQEDALKLNNTLNSAMEEIKKQDAKFIKDYSGAKDMLARVKAEAELLRSGLAAKKEEARKKALLAQGALTSALDDLRAKLPAAKASTLDLEALETDVKSAEDLAQEVQKLIVAEDFLAAEEKAKAARVKASGIYELIRESTEKKPVVAKKRAG